MIYCVLRKVLCTLLSIAGWIRAEWIKKDTGRRARVYELTAAGKKQLGIEESRWQSASAAINQVLRTV
jgi:PadR family transcriptional regulator PadR